MAREYYQNKMDRAHESRGMKGYSKRSAMDSGYMGMISEDRSAPSNLPQEVKHKYYPPCDYAGAKPLDDTIRGVDEATSSSIRKIESNPSDSMY